MTLKIFLTQCSRDVAEDTEIVTFDHCSLYKRIPHEFGLKALDYVLTTYQEKLYATFKKECFRISQLCT